MENVKRKAIAGRDRAIFHERSVATRADSETGTQLTLDQASAEYQCRLDGCGGVEISADTAAVSKTQSVPALERALTILEFLAKSRHGASHSLLTRRLQLPRSTCHALLLTFQRCGYIERDQKTGRYRLGFKLYTLANKSLSSIRLRDLAAPILHELMGETRLTVQLAVLVEGEAVLIDRIDPPGTPLVAWLGQRVGLHCTAIGKAFLAQLPEDQASQFALKQGLLRHNENTIVSVGRLRYACEVSRQVGYAIDEEEAEIGVRGIGAPVLSGRGTLLAAISISGAAAEMENISALAQRVTRASQEVANRIDDASNTEDVFSISRVSNVMAELC